MTVLMRHQTRNFAIFSVISNFFPGRIQMSNAKSSFDDWFNLAQIFRTWTVRTKNSVKSHFISHLNCFNTFLIALCSILTTERKIRQFESSILSAESTFRSAQSDQSISRHILTLQNNYYYFNGLYKEFRIVY